MGGGGILEDKVGCKRTGGLCSFLGHGASLGSGLDSFNHPRPGAEFTPFPQANATSICYGKRENTLKGLQGVTAMLSALGG